MSKLQDTWNAVESARLSANISWRIWRQSYEGVSAALKNLGLVMVTSKQQFKDLPVPHNGKQYSYIDRKIIVSRNGIESKPTPIKNLLSCHSQLLTEEEQKAIHVKVGEQRSAALGKGSAISNNIESTTIQQFHNLLNLEHHLCCHMLLEFRLADVAYALRDADVTASVFIADQVKTACVQETGQVAFTHRGKNITVAGILFILQEGMSLTCIAKSGEGEIHVVWYFQGDQAIQMLRDHDSQIDFKPIVHLKVPSKNPFTIACNDPQYRFDVGDVDVGRKEIQRLVESKLSFARSGPKHTIDWLNEDDSQIPHKNQRLEQKSFEATRSACRRKDFTVEKLSADSSSSVDFHVRGSCFDAKIQDKVIGSKSNSYCMRAYGGYPYHPDKFDALQISFVDSTSVYLIPMRVVVENGHVTSYHTEYELMRQVVVTGVDWRDRHQTMLYDLAEDSGLERYLKACEAASNIRSLTDRQFYDNVIANNTHKFGNRKKIKNSNRLRRESAKTDKSGVAPT